MARLAGGEDRALNDLMERHAPRIFHFLWRMLGNEEDARDLAQETFVRVYEHRGSFRGGEKFSHWLYTIAGNLARNQIRWRTRHPAASLDLEPEPGGRSLGEYLPSEAPPPGERLLAEERRAAVRRAIHSLPEGLREPLVLCELEDHSVISAATILEMSPRAVEARLYRARQALRKQLGPWLD